MRRFHRAIFIFLLSFWDLISVSLAMAIGLKLRFGFIGDIPSIYRNNIWIYILVSFILILFTNVLFRCYKSVWKYASAFDVVKQIASVLVFTFLGLILNFLFKLNIPSELFIIIPNLMFVLMILGRMSARFYYYMRGKIEAYSVSQTSKNVIIYGAGEAGTYLLKNLSKKNSENLNPVCFIDDNESLIDCKINNVEVMGTGKDLKFLINEYNVSEIIVAIPTASKEFLKDLMIKSKQFNCSLRRYGSIDDISDQDFEKASINQIKLEDLLRRDSVTLNMNIVKNFIEDKVVLVTGGVGSIGSEICRQVLSFNCKQLIIFDINENGLFDINNQLKDEFDKSNYELVLGSVRDKKRLNEIFKKFNPEIVFHAAAHKHVPLMELNPKEAIKNNVFGTLNAANISSFNNVEKFILISTDKAVNPTNIMGASKRIAEMLIQMMNKISDTEFAAVRFGNVLGSNGSVVPFFKNQIANGGPVTVTHEDMRRYFMTIPEAVQLVLEAGAMATGGEIFVLDMGEPVKIYDLACNMIRLSGFEPEKDIEIKFIGLRAGEKLFEEICLKDEDVKKTNNQKIHICKPIGQDLNNFAKDIKDLEKCLYYKQNEDIFSKVKEMVPTFNHNKNL